MGAGLPPPQLPITLVQVSLRSKALPGAPSITSGSHRLALPGWDQGPGCSRGSLTSPRTASVPAQALAALAQDPPWALQEPLLGEFSSLTWTGQERKLLVRGDYISWLKEVL